MRLGQFIKQPGETESYTVTYEDDLTAGDNLESVALVSVVPVGLVVDQIFVFDPRVRFFASGGTDGVVYKVTIRATTADSRILEDEIIIKVKEY